jgi:hypothetical protein
MSNIKLLMSECIKNCKRCIIHCKKMTGMKNCISACEDCIICCDIIIKYEVNNKQLCNMMLKICSMACKLCIKECKKHKEHEPCLNCIKSCEKCTKLYK